VLVVACEPSAVIDADHWEDATMTLSEPVQAAVSRTGEIVQRLVRTLVDELRTEAELPPTPDSRTHDSRPNISR